MASQVNEKPFELAEHSRIFPGEHSKSIEDVVRSAVDPRLKNLSLSRDDEDLLKGNLKGILKITPLKEGLSISSTSHIGVANFDSFSVVVKPKVLMCPKSLFGMINYAYELDFKPLPEYAPKFGENFLIDIIITSFVKQCQVLIKRGLYKSYVTHQDNISFLRGKLLIKQHLQNVLKNKPQFFCEFDELEYDNLENQIILFCLRRSYKLIKHDELKKDIRKLMFQISTVVSDQYVTKYDVEKIHYTRQNHQYVKIHEVCKLILESSGIVDLFSDRRHIVNSFFIDMNTIFEKFVFILFRESFQDEFHVSEQKKKKVWNIDDERTKSIRTDILLEGIKSSKKIVIDTKYKDDISDSDLYQIGFYVHEYSQKGLELERKRGYAVLPTRKNEPELKKSTYISEKQRIAVVKSFFNIDKAVSLLYSQEPNASEELRSMLESLLDE